MANKRIKDLSTTAAVTASDDFIAVDGATNGTRKLDAYSPTFGGNLTVSGGTTTIIGSAPALALKRSSDNSFVGYIDATTTGTLRLFSGVGGSNALAASFPQTGNLLLGTTTDGGYKLRVNGAIYSDGDIYAARANATSSVQLLPTSGVASGSDIASYNLAGPAWTRLNLRTSELAIYTNNGGTTALTLDSSQHFKLTPAVASSITTTQSAPQIRMGSRASGRSNVVLDSTAGRVWSLENTGTSLTVGYSGLDAITIAETTGDATFAGTIKPQQAATASAPTYVKGAIYFDTTLNKLRVGGATGWETITSV